MFLPIVVLLALSGVAAVAGGAHDNDDHRGGGLRGALGPLAGAGFPVILIGGGIY